MTSLVTVKTYIDNGLCYEYDVPTAEAAREHADAIIKGGYRHTADGYLTHIPPHRIVKVKCGPGIETNYPDRVSGT